MVFDFGKFAGDALRSVDRIRSLAANPRNINGNSQEPIESRINALYRAIGLPAITSDASKFPSNNGNVHDIVMTEDLRRQFSNREQDFSASIDDDVVESFLDGENDLSIKDSIEFRSSGTIQNPKRRRGSLFPMYVFGDVGVFPQDRRVAGAFFTTSNVIIDGTKYERPMLELIVLLRLRGDGVQDGSLQQQLNEEFSESLGEGFVDTTNLNLITFEIIRQLLQTTLNIKDVVRKTVQDLGRIRTQIRTIYEDQRANVPDQQAVTKSTSGLGTSEKQRSAQVSEQARKDSLLTLLEYDDTLSNGQLTTKNMKDAWLANSVLDLLTTDSQRIGVSSRESEKAALKLEKLNRAQHRKLDLLLGTFSGLSGLDVLVIITALFSITQADLLGLLNDEAFDRLRKIKGERFSASRSPVTSSVSALETKVTEIYDRLEEIINVNELLESNQIQSGGA